MLGIGANFDFSMDDVPGYLVGGGILVILIYVIAWFSVAQKHSVLWIFEIGIALLLIGIAIYIAKEFLT